MSTFKQAVETTLKQIKRGEKPENIGDFIMARIVEGKSGVDAIASEARRRYRSKTSPASVYWYRSELRRNGVKKLPRFPRSAAAK